jgi:hypothetical protein
MKVKYAGLRAQGTLRPRRMWRPGEILDVDDKIAEELIKGPEFTPVESSRSIRKREKA